MKSKVKLIGDYSLLQLETKINEFLENLEYTQISDIQYCKVIENGTVYFSCLISYYCN